MTNRTKIIVGILIIALIVVVIYGITSNKKTDESTNKKRHEVSNIMEYLDNETKKEEAEANNTKSNEISENEATKEIQKSSETKNNVVIGKEEQDSNKENTAATNEQKAIELAKKEWGLSVDSYDFRPELQSDGTYKVSIYNKTTTAHIVTYIVNVKTETVTEE